MMRAHKTSLMALRKPLKATNVQLSKSLLKQISVMPGLASHVEEERAEIKGFRGMTVKTYALDDVALAAFLYWRERRGRLPEIFRKSGAEKGGEA